MTLDPTRLLLAFREPTAPEDVTGLIAEYNLELEDNEQEGARGLPEFVNHTEQRYWVRTIDGRDAAEAYARLTDALVGRLSWVGPVYRIVGGGGRGSMVSPLPHVLLVEPTQAGVERTRGLDRLARQHGLREVKEKSAHLGAYRYFEVTEPLERTAYEVQEQLLNDPTVANIQFENMPMVVPVAVVPNDTLFAQQWAMTRIQAGGPGTTGWDLGSGAGVTVCILDSGVDLTHPDLNIPNQGIRLDTMMATGAPQGPAGVIGHGTACAGLAAGQLNNATGVAGVSGNASVLPVAFVNWTDAEVAAGINWAAANGADVISMSFRQYAPGDGFGPTGWNFAVIDPAVTNAVDVAGCVLVAATGNENQGTINGYPARNGRVIAVGGSDQADNRKSPASADGECWGACFGPGTSVVAPCVLNPTTDIQGATGYNVNGGARMVACVNYASSGDAAGDYFLQFNGTSSATPIVAGVAAAIRGANPTLTNLAVRDLLERTADKVGGAYADVAGFPNGTRNNQMGYGRVNLFRALDAADSYIRDYPGDTGTEPSTPPGGDFWDFSDIVVRIFDDNVFAPGDPSQSSNVERGQTNYIYVRVTNLGARDARNVVVSVRITPYVGLQFVYPADWTLVDSAHVSPTPIVATFVSVPAGASVIAKFSVSASEVETLWGWISSNSWHPCLLAVVTSDNDYAWATASTGASPQVRRNNIAQRNLSVINVLASASVTFPFIMGSAFNDETRAELAVDRSRVPKEMVVLLSLDEDGAAFPSLRLESGRGDEDEHKGTVFLDRTRMETELGCCRGVLTLEAGSRFDCRPAHRLKVTWVRGGDVVLRGERRYVQIRDDVTLIGLERQPRQMDPLALHAEIPADAPPEASYWFTVSQRDGRGQIVGGASVVYRTD